MSSTSNAQDLLVNVFRPTYKWDSNTGFVPSVVVSNVTELIASKIQTSALVVSDSNNNTYIGDSAGINASNTLSNVGIGYSAMGGSLNSDCNVAIGTFALDGLANSDSNVAVGAGTDITGTGVRNILLGTNVTLAGGGSNNILIGVDLSRTAISNTLQIGSLLYGNLANGYIGINNPTPMSALDISGDVVFRNKVGIQKENPDYSLDVAGTLYVSSQVLTGGGLASAPTYSFDSYRTSGFYRPTDASYGVGAIGITISEIPRLVVTSNKTYIYGDLDICGTLTASGGGGGGGGGGSGTIAANGSASAPSFTFSNDLSTGLHLGGTSILAFDTSGRQRMTLSNGFLGIGTTTPRVALDVSGDISANVYNGPGGTQSAPHYTFSDDRTTGVFFPGANMVGFTAGGLERMRISNSNIGIGTRTPSNALDVSGTLRVIGTAGDITFTNGAIAIGGSNVISSTGVLSNSSGTSNSIGGVVLETSNVLASSFESSPSTSNIIGGVTLRNSNAIVGGFLRNALTPTTYDISGGNISNSGVTRSTNFLAVPGGASRPGYAFTTDPSSGFDLAGASQIAFETAGLQRMVLSNANLGIGTATPRVALDVSGDISANVYNGPGGTQAAPHYTFSDDRTTGVFFPGANIVGFTAGGTERMRISNSNIGIGTTAPSNALDVSGTLRVIGTSGDITFTNGAIGIGGSNVISSTGVLSNGTATSNSIGGVTLWGSNIDGNAFSAGSGMQYTPTFTFLYEPGTGLYQAQDASYGTGALGIAVNQSERIVVMSNKTFIYGDLDVCGTFNAASGGGGGGGGGSTTEDVRYVTTGGTLSFPSGYSNAHVTLVGGGGGGGGAGAESAGGGGGAGYTVTQLFTSGGTLVITLGAGGAGGAADGMTGNEGGAGSMSTVQCGTANLRAPGGAGGAGGAAPGTVGAGAGAGGAGLYGGGGGSVYQLLAASGGPGGGKWMDGDPGFQDGGRGGGAADNGGYAPGGGGGGGGGGGEGGQGGTSLGGGGSGGSAGGLGCGGGGGGGGEGGSGLYGSGGAGGNGYCIVRFLP